MKSIVVISFLVLWPLPHVWACTDKFEPVCGYWMHSSKTQTFKNECMARESGAKVRHKGSCADAPTKPAPAQAGNKPGH